MKSHERSRTYMILAGSFVNDYDHMDKRSSNFQFNSNIGFVEIVHGIIAHGRTRTRFEQSFRYPTSRSQTNDIMIT